MDANDTKTPSDTLLTAEHFRITKYGKLKMESPVDSSRGSHKKTEWICDCGRVTTKSICCVVSRNTSSCGKCNLLTEAHFGTTKYGSLKLKHPRDLMPGSRKKQLWICDCGNEVEIQTSSVTSGHTKTCGKCSILTAQHFKVAKYGKLMMVKPCDFHPSSHKEVSWICDCGQITIRQIGLVVSGHTSSCGKCNIRDKKFWASTEFGKLTMSTPQAISLGSNREVDWKCRCGGTIRSNIYAVTSGKTTRCGQCRSKAVDWYQRNKHVIRSLRTPFPANAIPSGWIKPLESINRYMKPFRALCGACGSEYSPIWSNIVKGSSLTCGCVSNHISGVQRDMALWIKTLGLKVLMEYPVNQLKYDIYIPDSNLLVEYQGLRWHSRQGSRKRDINKYRNAIDAGFEFIAIFEDEWIAGREKFRQLLKSRLGLMKAKSVRPSKCQIRIISYKEVTPLYNKFHYIGTCKAKIHYGVYLDNRLIAAASFGRPTRQSSYPWELLRMVSDSDYKIHGIWSKLMSIFIQEQNPSSIVSFSDNRLFNGRTYLKIGFQLDGKIRPDYYWVKGNKRYHKSGLRKKGVERGLSATESQLRGQQGFKKIWDLGKKRWVWHSN